MFYEKSPEIREERVGNEEMREREVIERIENLRFVKLEERMDLILTYFEEKPASIIKITFESKKPFARLEEELSKAEELKRALMAGKLVFKILEAEGIDDNGFDYKTFQFLIGKDKEKIQELEKALVEGDRRAMEKLLGYPETSIESSFEGRVLDKTEWWESLSQREKEDLPQEGVLNFINFPLSKEHWQEELEVARGRQAKIKEKAPKLYSEILEQKPKVAMSKKEREEQERREIEEYLAKIRQEVAKLVDKLGLPVEEGIKETVVMLNAFEIRTSASCEGHFEKKGEKIKYFDGEKIFEKVFQEDGVRPSWIDIESRISEIEN